jgi:hypothetical protein
LSAENQENESGGNRLLLLQCPMERLREREARIRRQQSSSSGPGDDDEGITPQPSHRGPWQREEAKSAPPVRCTGEAPMCHRLGNCRVDEYASHRGFCCSPMAAPTMETCGLVGAALDCPGRGRAVLNVDPHTLSRAVQYFDIIARSAGSWCCH